MNSPPARYESRLRAFCRQVGATDLETWLGVPVGTRGPAALAALERKRLALESAATADAQAASQAELLQDHYRMLQRAMQAGAAGADPAQADMPDYYGTLGVTSTSTFQEIEQAWRRLVTGGRQDQAAEQAWRVLGDPLNRANYDRSRREQLLARHGGPGWTTDPPTPVSGLLTDPGACQVELIGPDLRVVEIAQTPVSVPVAVRVHGRAPWDARVHTSHPAVTTSPADRCQLPPGRHTIQIRVDPSALDHAVADATVTLQGGAEHVAITLRFRRIRPPGWTRLEVVLLGLLGASLVGLGWWLGARTTIGQAPRTPGSEGDAEKKSRTRFLPDNIYDGIRLFKGSKYMSEILGETVVGKFAEVKQLQADRCSKALGSMIKVPEIQFHHEVTNQYLWNQF
ncbi:MAG TPA: hypothetical protein PKA64_23965 [Myxococcota bacterium]|nr:hypothetical protein [Myxococcota bacterium]